MSLLAGLAAMAAGLAWRAWLIGPAANKPKPRWIPPPVPREARPRRTALQPAAPERTLASMTAETPNAFSDAAVRDAVASGAVASIDARKLTALDEVLRTGNDNDPRLDRDFNELTPAQRRLFRAKYAQLAAERRNDLGTIVFLLGKNLRSVEDWEFLKRVVREPPCQSMTDCSKPPASKEHGQESLEITLVYPQLVALEQARKVVSSNSIFSPDAMAVLEAGQSSGSPLVARKATEIIAGL